MSKSVPRIATKEMIVTRFKSAQQKRQLRDKDRTITKVTQLLKSPHKKKKPRSPRKDKDRSLVLTDDGTTKDYYPDKLKRAVVGKKAFLKPKPQMTTVAKTNKRKFNTPRKTGVEPPPLPLNKTSQDWLLSTSSEPIWLVEDTESLDEDDLMEILTCPSPVWWEPHPLYGYMEEPIRQLNPVNTPKIHETKSPCTEKDTETSKVADVTIENILDTSSLIKDNDLKVEGKGDERFIRKRKKLENVLGNIKNIALTVRNAVKINTLAKSNQSTTKDMDTVERGNVTKDLIVIKETQSKVNSQHKINETSKQTETVKYVKGKKISESTEEDMAELYIRDDDMLIDLENMDIPIGNPADETPSSESVIVINDDEESEKTISGNRAMIYLIDISNETKDKVIDVEAEECRQNLLNDIQEVCSNTCEGSDIATVDKEKVKTIEGAEEFKLGLLNDIEEICSNPCEKIDTVDEKINITIELAEELKQDLLDDISEQISLLSNKDDTATIDKLQDIKVESDSFNETGFDGAQIDLIQVPKNLPPLKKRPQYATPVHIPIKKQVEEIETSTASQEVSEDINMEENKNDTQDEDDLEKYIIQNGGSKSDGLKSNADLVTVYKMIPNERNLTNKFKTIPEYSNFVQNLNQVENNDREDPNMKGQINSFFKKCKNTYRKKCKREDENSEKSDPESLCDSCDPKISITVAQGRMLSTV